MNVCFGKDDEDGYMTGALSRQNVLNRRITLSQASYMISSCVNSGNFELLTNFINETHRLDCVFESLSLLKPLHNRGEIVNYLEVLSQEIPDLLLSVKSIKVSRNDRTIRTVLKATGTKVRSGMSKKYITSLSKGAFHQTEESRQKVAILEKSNKPISLDLELIIAVNLDSTITVVENVTCCVMYVDAKEAILPQTPNEISKLIDSYVAAEQTELTEYRKTCPCFSGGSCGKRSIESENVESSETSKRIK